MSDETKAPHPLEIRDESEVRAWAVSQAQLLRAAAVRLSDMAALDVHHAELSAILHMQDGTTVDLTSSPDGRTLTISIRLDDAIHVSFADDGAMLRLDDPQDELRLAMRRIAALDDHVEFLSCDLVEGAIATARVMLGIPRSIDPVAIALATDNDRPRFEHVAHPGWPSPRPTASTTIRGAGPCLRVDYRLDEHGRAVGSITSHDENVRIPSVAEIGPIEAMRASTAK